MPTTTNKQRLLAQLFAAHKKGHEPAEPEPRPVLEQFIYGLCREGTTREQADRAFCGLQDRFFDWNEIRVSSVHEVTEVFDDLPGGESRAERLISFLQQVFDATFSFDLESLHKKGLKQAAKQLSRYQAANDYVVAWVVQQTLGGHAIPLDAPSLRALRRLGFIDNEHDDLEAIRASLEHLVPKARGPLFGDLISNLANDACWQEDPNCPTCPLADECPTGQEAPRESLTPARSRTKPR